MAHLLSSRVATPICPRTAGALQYLSSHSSYSEEPMELVHTCFPLCKPASSARCCADWQPMDKVTVLRYVPNRSMHLPLVSVPVRSFKRCLIQRMLSCEPSPEARTRVLQGLHSAGTAMSECCFDRFDVRAARCTHATVPCRYGKRPASGGEGRHCCWSSPVATTTHH